MSDDLLKLAERCEAATGPDRDLDHDIYMAADIENGSFEMRYTASLDAAMTLVPENVFDKIASGAGALRCFAQLIYPKRSFIFPSGIVRRPPSIYVCAATQPLALCAAALRARSAA